MKSALTKLFQLPPSMMVRTIVLDDKENLEYVVALKLLRSVYLSTQNPLHHIGFGVVLLHMLTPKDLDIIIVKVTCIISLKCKIIFNITSTYITTIISGNVGFFAGTIALEVAYSMTTVALNIGGTTSGCG
jgi:hypothetical protein